LSTLTLLFRFLKQTLKRYSIDVTFKAATKKPQAFKSTITTVEAAVANGRSEFELKDHVH